MYSIRGKIGHISHISHRKLDGLYHGSQEAEKKMSVCSRISRVYLGYISCISQEYLKYILGTTSKKKCKMNNIVHLSNFPLPPGPISDNWKSDKWWLLNDYGILSKSYISKWNKPRENIRPVRALEVPYRPRNKQKHFISSKTPWSMQNSLYGVCSDILAMICNVFSSTWGHRKGEPFLKGLSHNNKSDYQQINSYKIQKSMHLRAKFCSKTMFVHTRVLDT